VSILAGAIVVGSIGAAIAYQNGPPAVIAAFDYFYLIFSLLWGWIIFSHFPDWIALVGIALIIAAGYLVIAHNAQAR
jgi:drug/metabolite transporter (DMT)-like permease